MVAFSSILVKVSNQDSDTRYAAIKKKLPQNAVWSYFDKKAKDMLKRIESFNAEASNCPCEVYLSDSRNLDFLKKEIDLVITSPPYLNSYDYYLYHKHRMLWLGLDYRSAQEKEFGSRNKHSDNHEGIESYVDAVTASVSHISKNLKKNAHFCVIIGDAILKGEIIKMNAIFDEIFLKQGYTKTREIRFEQRKYTRTFTPNIKTKFKESYILIYRR
ncbi:MAG: DNA methyltransferase [Candidatus ainarchaeum sp.]|nr:DNA methyltransferase [Candidatus ainarchaeum sp.]